MDTLPPAEHSRFPSDTTMSYTDELFHTAYGERLSNAVEELYGAFSTSLDSDLTYCTHCFTAGDIAYLKSHPLRELTYADAALIQANVTLVLGTGSDFNYFLPRILDAMAHGGLYMENALPVAMGRGREAGWNERQLGAVVEFVRAFFFCINALPENDLWKAACDDLLIKELRGVVPEAADAMKIDC